MAVRPARSSRSIALLPVIALHLAVVLLFKLPLPAGGDAGTAVTASFLQELPQETATPRVPPPELQRLVLPEVPLPQMPQVPTPITLRVVSEPPVMLASAAAVDRPEFVQLTQELALSCPLRTPPNYPSQSRRLREQGTVLLRVELDESGRVADVAVARSSGSSRLDDAGSTTVRRWRCQPALRDGRAVRAVAMQEFEFVLM